jgi:hypothetical protein
MPEHWNYFTENKPKQVNKVEYIKLGVGIDDLNDEEFEKSHGPEYVEEQYYEYLNRKCIIEDFTSSSSSIDKEKIFAELHGYEKNTIQEYVYYFKGYTSDVSKNIELSKKSFSPTFFCN